MRTGLGELGIRIFRCVVAAALCGACAGTAWAQKSIQQSIQQLRAEFASPPADARPMVRWWWFGPAVVKPEIARELDVMHAAGIGGVELAAEYPMALDDPAKGILNLRYGSPEYVDDLKFANEHARALGMRVDLTLGSGWPYGGPNVPIDLASGKLRVVAVALGGGGGVPKLGAGESFVAAFVANGTPGEWDAAGAKRVAGDRMPAELAQAHGPGPGPGPQVELFFISSHTRQQVKRAAFGGEGYVLDHMSRAAIEHYQQTTGDDLLGGFAGAAPYAIFSDSLEVYGADWTKDLPAEFARRRGYDLIPHLPELVQGGTPEAESVRRDWGLTLSELVRDNYLRPMAEYATAHGTKFRSQTYGQPPVTLSDEPIPQLPEGEGPQWHAFSFTRWASSANHVYGNKITSAETFTWLHSPAWRATPLDMKAEADCMFLEGVNQVVEHGFPYSAPGVAEPGWSLYAAGALNDHNPWWPMMHDVAGYIQRVSWVLRQGEPANDVALLLPEDDAQATFRPVGHVSVTDEMHKRITSDLMGAMLDTGYNVDYIDLAAAEDRGLHYPILAVPPTERMPLRGVRVLEQYVAGGGKLVFVGQTPSRAAGLADAGDTAAVAAGVRELLEKATHVATTGELASALPRLLQPDVELGGAGGKVGFLHRRLSDGDIYFFANTTAEPVSFPVRVRSKYHDAEWWDTDGGQAERAELGETLTLPAYGSRLLVLHNGAQGLPAAKRIQGVPEGPPIKLTEWSVAFPGSAGSAPQPLERGITDTMWTDNAATRFYSGEVRYTTSFRLNAFKKREYVQLSFAAGKPLQNNRPPGSPGMRAWLDPPIHEAAEVWVNEKHVGDLWHPPYEIDISSAAHPGENTLELRVFNTAINELAGQPPRDYTALKAKYGDRFQMQDMNNLQPVPSGIRGPVQIDYGAEVTQNLRPQS